MDFINEYFDGKKDDEFKLLEHHKYTCDRFNQSGQFKIYQAKRPEVQRLHFFYFYGGDLQAHSGLFQRFIGRLKGINKIRKNYLAPGYTVKSFSFKIPKDPSLEALEIELRRQFMEEIGLNQAQIERLKEQTLARAIKESPQLNALTNQDKVCVHISIPEHRWELNTTPVIAKWLIEHFCLSGMTADCPEFFIFYSIEYNEENTDIKAEIEKAMQEAEFTNGLPELSMVKNSDLGEWFEDNVEFWERKYPFIKTFIKWLNKVEGEMYMEDVQHFLEDKINKAKQTDKHANKHS